ncbi:hypothetical protein AVEN_235598-1 [Araneus ventricosus]|uniref:Uncharacterized protein n=1 Tax=Araneus ventricosus TaxID=182803 RepID=A0A4Y2BR22_ARAVE|nr:hypothetical protein AVEN_235598-1 [Araneus ventricosus]
MSHSKHSPTKSSSKEKCEGSLGNLIPCIFFYHFEIGNNVEMIFLILSESKVSLSLDITFDKNPSIDSTQIAILVCSRLALHICKLSANLSRQVCKCETSLQQVNASLEVTIGRTCSKLALQTIAKTEYEHNP